MIGVMSTKTGIIFNDEMDDFTTKPNEPNIYGLPPSKYNLIRPGAIPTSSMSPTILLDNNQNARLVIGGSGGPRIISTVASVIECKHFCKVIFIENSSSTIYNKYCIINFYC